MAQLVYLALAVDTEETRGGFVVGGDKDGLARNTVHKDASARLEVVQVQVAVLGDEEDNVVLFGDLQKHYRLKPKTPSIFFFRAYLHRHGEVVGKFRGEEDIDSLLGEGRIAFLVVNLDHVELGAGGTANGKAENLGGRSTALKDKFSKGSSVTLNGLGNVALARIELFFFFFFGWVGRLQKINNEKYCASTCMAPTTRPC